MSDVAQKTKKPIYKKWWFWVIVIFLITLIASAGSKPTQTPQTAVNDAASTANNSKIVVNIPSLLGKKWSELKETLTPVCGSDVVSKAETTHALNCIINDNYNFYFEFDDNGLVTDNDEFMFVGHTQKGGTEASVLEAAGVVKDSTAYKVSIKTDSTGQIILKVSR